MSLDMTAVQRGLFRRLGRRSNRREYFLPDAPLAPAGKAIVDRLVGAILPRAVHPATTHFQHMHDPAQNQPIVFTLRSRLFCRQMRLDLCPLLIVEPK